mmetsp:Transcript_45195/g.45770  ORF Transcript_45195/g.45770 Transcript_45195/m.45770 type:complete len:89 (+) Transcript_45195:139-405(+)
MTYFNKTIGGIVVWCHYTNCSVMCHHFIKGDDDDSFIRMSTTLVSSIFSKLICVDSSEFSKLILLDLITIKNNVILRTTTTTTTLGED